MFLNIIDTTFVWYLSPPKFVDMIRGLLLRLNRIWFKYIIQYNLSRNPAKWLFSGKILGSGRNWAEFCIPVGIWQIYEYGRIPVRFWNLVELEPDLNFTKSGSGDQETEWWFWFWCWSGSCKTQSVSCLLTLEVVSIHESYFQNPMTTQTKLIL